MGRERCYTPGPEDVGAILKFDCTAYDAASPYPEVGKTFSIITARVRPGEGGGRVVGITVLSTRSGSCWG